MVAKLGTWLRIHSYGSDRTMQWGRVGQKWFSKKKIGVVAFSNLAEFFSFFGLVIGKMRSKGQVSEIDKRKNMNQVGDLFSIWRLKQR